MTIFFLLSSLGLFLAGLIHLFISPDHFSHAPAHGTFFALSGVLQVGWSLLALRSGLRPRRWLRWGGLILSGGMVALWLLTQWVQTPFADAPEPVDWATLICKAAEGLAFVSLIAAVSRNTEARRGSQAAALLRATSTAGLGGLLVWGSGLLVTPLFPNLIHTHNHSLNFAVFPSSAAYFSMVYSGKEADQLMGVSSARIQSMTLHETTLTDGVARMVPLETITFAPHTVVSFAPGGKHIMLDGLAGDLYNGEIIPVQFHFASGRTITVHFTVLQDAPTGRVNFVSSDGFQITNAWMRATVNANGLISLADGGYEWQLPPGFPLPRVPDNNPMTAEKAELGRYLFYDQRLSGNGTLACAGCHIQALAFTDGKAVSSGSTGDSTPRNSPSLTNVAYNATYTWSNPNLLVLERQIVIPMFGEHPVEMGITGNEDTVITRLQQDERYQRLFAAAFPQQVQPFTFNNITLALSSFVRTLLSGNSAYDQYMRGNTAALSESARRGMDMFLSENFECHHCHTGFNFSLSTVIASTTLDERPFFNTGLYNVGGTGAYAAPNSGIYEITNRPEDMGRFRPPSLRNVALTAPYMHDGSITTLEEVIQFYANGGRNITEGEFAGDGRKNPFKSGFVPGFTLSDQQKADFVAFLESLTDEQFTRDPRFSDPFIVSGS